MPAQLHSLVPSKTRIKTNAVCLCVPPQDNWSSLRMEFAQLNPAQLHHLLREYSLGRAGPLAWTPSSAEAQAAFRTGQTPLAFCYGHSFDLRRGGGLLARVQRDRSLCPLPNLPRHYTEKVPTGKFYSKTAGAVMTTMYEVMSVGAVVIQPLKPDLSVILIFFVPVVIPLQE